MKWFIFIVTGLLIVMGVILIALSVASREQPDLGLQNGQLAPCPSHQNCVCSEKQDDAAYIKPLRYNLPVNETWARLKSVIRETGGYVIAENTNYLRAEYKSALFRFIDDVEFRLDQQHQSIQVRSASRVGQSDLGANRQRVEQIRNHFNHMIAKEKETP